MTKTYFICLGAKQQQVEWDCRHDIDEEPAFEVVYGDLSRVTYHLVVFIHVSRTKVYQYVDDEHDVDDEIDYSKWMCVAAVSVTLVASLLVQQECRHIRRDYRSIDNQYEYEPVPDCLKW